MPLAEIHWRVAPLRYLDALMSELHDPFWRSIDTPESKTLIGFATVRSFNLGGLKSTHVLFAYNYWQGLFT